MKKSIAFYIDNSKITNVNLSNPSKGNPGIGATQYLITLIASEFQKKFKEQFEVYLFTTNKGLFPDNIKTVVVINELNAVKLCKDYKIEIMISRTTTNLEFYKIANDTKQKIITWSHNRLWLDHVNILSNSEYVVSNVCVGHNQKEELRSHPVYEKTITIFNPSLMSSQIHNRKSSDLSNSVTYVGNISKERGLHVLLSIWKDVKKEVPDAKLNIIGGSNLYDRSLKTGDLGLSNRKYEKKLKKFLYTNGVKDKSIYFHGILGEEKNDIFNETKVGIINPFGYETLGLSGIEMACKGIPLVTINQNGQSEIVKNNKTGFLFENKKQFKNYIIELLKNDDLNDVFSVNSINFMRTKFSLDDILNSWLYLIESSIQKEITNRKNTIKKPKISMFYLKSIMRKILLKK